MNHKKVFLSELEDLSTILKRKQEKYMNKKITQLGKAKVANGIQGLSIILAIGFMSTAHAQRSGGNPVSCAPGYTYSVAANECIWSGGNSGGSVLPGSTVQSTYACPTAALVGKVTLIEISKVAYEPAQAGSAIDVIKVQGTRGIIEPSGANKMIINNPIEIRYHMVTDPGSDQFLLRRKQFSKVCFEFSQLALSLGRKLIFTEIQTQGSGFYTVSQGTLQGPTLALENGQPSTAVQLLPCIYNITTTANLASDGAVTAPGACEIQ